MKSPRRRMVGASRSVASSRSLSSHRVIRRGLGAPAWASVAASPAVPPEPPAIGFFIALAVNLTQFTGRPLDRILGLHALHALGEHVHDDVLRVDLGGLRRRLPRVPEDPGVVGGGAEARHRLGDRAPERMLLPELGRTDREAFRHLEPLPELLLAV